MNAQQRHELTQRLGGLMAAISEECYHAGWMGNTEYLIPELCRRAIATGTPQLWGHGTITARQASELTAIAQELGHWADLDEPGIGYVPFDPFPIPKEYVEEIEREQASGH